MKILAVYNPKSGGSYHRVKLWSEFVENVTLVQDLTEELVSTCDILYIHWNSKTTITDLSIWREKYGFKIIADIDDVWQNIGSTLHTDFLSQHLCLLADQVICSTEYLIRDIIDWNKNVKVIPNLIPMGYGQFTQKTKIHKKVRVGIGGSISHLEDYLSLAPTIRKLEKQKWFQDKCEFVIIGYDRLDPRWDQVYKMFKDVRTFKYKSPEEYMSLYDEVDIMLLPLLDTELNRGRSNLKVYECISKGVIPLLDSANFINEDPINVNIWGISTNHVEDFVDKKQRKVFIESIISRLVNNNYNYSLQCVDSRKQIFEEILRRSTSISSHHLHSIIYLASQDVEYTPWGNTVKTIEEKSYLFEYNPIINIVDNHIHDDTEYTAFFSHKFPHKTGFYKKYVEDILDNEDSDVVIFCKQYSNYLEWTEQQHPGFMDIFIKVCQKLELVIPSEYPVVYSNFFAAKANVYKEYVEVLKKAIDIMETDLEIKELCWKDAQYKSGLNSEDLKKFTELDYYTFHTFILERLMSIWIINKNLSYGIYD